MRELKWPGRVKERLVRTCPEIPTHPSQKLQRRIFLSMSEVKFFLLLGVGRLKFSKIYFFRKEVLINHKSELAQLKVLIFFSFQTRSPEKQPARILQTSFPSRFFVNIGFLPK